ncbi:hypothetical protein [Sphingomonas sp. VNH70]|uniref:hypothetical protein n=1 Tax=Sphingomonas silueang TaxID=3156617 RepID=UPI0032B45A9A
MTEPCVDVRRSYATDVFKPGAAMLRFHPMDRFSDDGNIVDLPDYRSRASRRYVKLGERPSVRMQVAEQVIPDTPVTEGSKPHGPRIGFLKGRISVPDDFDTIGQAEIEAMFGG